MSPYITFKDFSIKDGTLVLYILQRDFPHYCGGIAYHPIADSICCVPMAGHNLWVSYCGTIRGNYIPSYEHALPEIEAVFQHMAAWFYSERIMKDPKRYKKWLIPSS